MELSPGSFVPNKIAALGDRLVTWWRENGSSILRDACVVLANAEAFVPRYAQKLSPPTYPPAPTINPNEFPTQ